MNWRRSWKSHQARVAWPRHPTENVPLKTFVPGCCAANLLWEGRWLDGRSLLIKESSKASSHPTSERSDFANVTAVNSATKHSKSSPRLRYDFTNNPLPMGVLAFCLQLAIAVVNYEQSDRPQKNFNQCVTIILYRLLRMYTITEPFHKLTLVVGPGHCGLP